MLLWILCGLFLLGIAVELCLNAVHKGSKRLYTRLSHWVVYLFVTVLSIVLYFNQIPVGQFFQNLTTLKVIGIALSILLLLVLFELASPMNFILRIFRRQKNPPQEEGEAVYSEREYEGFLRLVVGLISLFVILAAPVNWGLGLAGAALEQQGLICIVGILVVVLLPVCVRQIIYYLVRIKRTKPDPGMARIDRSYDIVDGYLRRRHKKL